MINAKTKFIAIGIGVDVYKRQVWFLTVRKDGEKIGFYKFSFVGEGPYNQKTDPECYFNIYTHDADLITDNPTRCV